MSIFSRLKREQPAILESQSEQFDAELARSEKARDLTVKSRNLNLKKAALFLGAGILLTVAVFTTPIIPLLIPFLAATGYTTFSAGAVAIGLPAGLGLAGLYEAGAAAVDQLKLSVHNATAAGHRRIQAAGAGK